MRDLRLRSIANFPLGTFETFATALALTELNWRGRGALNEELSRFQIVAYVPGERWVGTMTTVVSGGPPDYQPSAAPADASARTDLLDVWVDRTYRGRAGIATRLLETVRNWTISVHRHDKLHVHVHVHEGNHRATRFFEKNGATRTGEYINDPRSYWERHYELVLPAAAQS